MDDAALGGKVLIAAQPVVAQPRGRTVGGGSATALLPALRPMTLT